MSGEHVVYGFLRPLLRWLAPEHRITILHYEGQPPPQDLIEAGVQLIEVPDRYRNWVRRAWWEIRHLREHVGRSNSNLLLNVSGALGPNCDIPQVVLCQNPWSYRPSAHRGLKDKIKAALQRYGYRRAYRNANMMVYISSHLRELYQKHNRGRKERLFEIAYVGIDESTFEAATRLQHEPRVPNSILSVSAMAPWKGADTLVRALQLLHERGINAKLNLVGPWPNADYEQFVRRLIGQLRLNDSVAILGKVDVRELHHLYASNRMFCLMSSCESFGIPAAEAMAFGTPVVSAECCAIAEICNGAGLFGPADDPLWTANALECGLTDDRKWTDWSIRARERAVELEWDRCAKPLRQIAQLANGGDSLRKSGGPFAHTTATRQR